MNVRSFPGRCTIRRRAAGHRSVRGCSTGCHSTASAAKTAAFAVDQAVQRDLSGGFTGCQSIAFTLRKVRTADQHAGKSFFALAGDQLCTVCVGQCNRVPSVSADGHQDGTLRRRIAEILGHARGTKGNDQTAGNRGFAVVVQRAVAAADGPVHIGLAAADGIRPPVIEASPL